MAIYLIIISVMPNETDCESKPELLIIGGSGVMGQMLTQHVREEGYAVHTPPHSEFDITASEADIRAFLKDLKPDMVINASVANVTVDQAELERGNHLGNVWLTNAVGPERIARACLEIEIPFIHLSTDYVLGGLTYPHRESEEWAPVNWYGESKAESERQIVALGGKFHIVRVQRPLSYNLNVHRSDFLRDAVRALSEEREFYAINNQYLTPSSDRESARAILEIMHSLNYGIWHVASPTITTPHEIIKLTLTKLESLGKQIKWELLREACFEDFISRWKAPRPKHTAFDTTRFVQNFGGEILHPLNQMLDDWVSGYISR